MCSTCSALAGSRGRGASEPNLRNINRIAERAAREEGGLDSMAERAARADGPAQHCRVAWADEPAQHCAKNNLLLRESCRPKGGPFAFFEATARELDQELEERLSDQTGNDFHLADHDFKCPSKHKTLRLAQRAPCLSWRAVWELSRAPIPSPAGLSLARPLHVQHVFCIGWEQRAWR